MCRISLSGAQEKTASKSRCATLPIPCKLADIKRKLLVLPVGLLDFFLMLLLAYCSKDRCAFGQSAHHNNNGCWFVIKAVSLTSFGVSVEYSLERCKHPFWTDLWKIFRFVLSHPFGLIMI